MTPIVWAWILIGGMGVLIDLVFLSRFWIDRRQLQRDHLNGGDEILNTMYIGIGILAIMKHLIILAVGIAAGNAPNSGGGRGPGVSPITLIITFGLFGEEVLTVLTPAWVLWRRNILRVYLSSRAGTHFLTHLLARYQSEGGDHGDGIHGTRDHGRDRGGHTGTGGQVS